MTAWLRENGHLVNCKRVRRLLRLMGLEAVTRSLQMARPEIFNTDQGSRFTSNAFTGILKDHEIAISMDGRGRALDNIYVERLWRSVKYEEV